MLKSFFITILLFNFTYAQFKTASCPKKEELYKNENSIWVTKSNWRSFNTSFITNITKFSGAEWQGEKIGKLLCTYTDESPYTFPVTLQSPFLSIEPTGEFWKISKNKKYYTCTNTNIENCTVKRKFEAVDNLDSDKAVRDFLNQIKSKTKP